MCEKIITSVREDNQDLHKSRLNVKIIVYVRQSPLLRGDMGMYIIEKTQCGGYNENCIN